MSAGQHHHHTARRLRLSGRPSPAPPGARRRAPSCVRNRARYGRNGGAGSSEAEEPGPKGDAKQIPSASTVEPVLLTRGGHRTEHGRTVQGSTFVPWRVRPPIARSAGCRAGASGLSVSVRLAVRSVHSWAASTSQAKDAPVSTFIQAPFPSDMHGSFIVMQGSPRYLYDRRSGDHGRGRPHGADDV